MNAMLPPSPLVLSSPPLVSYLLRHAAEQPDRLALIDGDTGQGCTYAQLRQTVSALAAGLADAGVAAGSRVAILAKNSKPYVELLLALAALGAIAVPLNIRLHPKEMARNIADAQAHAIVSDATLLPAAEPISAQVPSVRLKLVMGTEAAGWLPLGVLAERGASTPFPLDAGDGATVCTLLYTSGTTGQAKGCALAQRTWTEYATNMAATMGLGRSDTYLALLPYFHIAGLGTLLSQLVLGGTAVTMAIPDPARMHELIAAHAVTVAFVVPGISGPFIELAPAGASSLRLVIIGAGLERRDVPAAIRDRLGADCVAIYGQSESGTKLTWATAADLERNPGTYGRFMPTMTYRLVDEEDRDVPEGQPGELIVRGGSVMLGYWNRPEASAEALRNGWMHTGDVFVRESGGTLRMVDRVKYLIKTGGENVYPQEVENVLREHPDVADVAVGGVPHPHWGEAVKAYIVPAAGAMPDRAGLAEWVRQSIARYKVPRYIEFVDKIPRNESGKIVKYLLAERPVDESQAVPGSGHA